MHNRLDQINGMTPDQICCRWRENKCSEFRWNDEKNEWYCGTKGVYRVHHLTRHDWHPIHTPTAFRFNVSATNKLNGAIAKFELQELPEKVDSWRIPCIADEKYTTLGEIVAFVETRLLSKIRSPFAR